MPFGNIPFPDPTSPRGELDPATLETPRVWSSAALATPPDDDIYDCRANHSRHDEFMGICQQCTDEKSEAMEDTDLVYYLVLSTNHVIERGSYRGSSSQSGGRQIYKLVKCGSREAAAVEAFYAAGVSGWNVVFSCVARLGETWEERKGKTERVDALWELAEEKSGQGVRVFY